MTWTPDYYRTAERLLVVGDSITYRGETSPTYVQDAIAPKAPILVDGALVTPPPVGTVGSFCDNTSYAPYPYWSEGHGGYTSAQLLAGLPTWALSYRERPTIAIVLCGVNDLSAAVPQATILSNIAAIKALIVSYYPRCRVYIGLLIPTSGAYDSLNTSITALNTALAAAHTDIVDFTADFVAATMLDDGLHPNTLGATTMGNGARSTIGVLS